MAGRAVRADVHDGVLARDRRLGHAEPALRHAWRSTCGRWPPRCAPSTRPSSTEASCSRSTRPTSPSSATRSSPIARCRSSSTWVELVVDAINGALDGIDPDAVRLHVCWGNYEGPHTHDVPFDDIQPLLYEAQRRRPRDLDGQRPPRPRGAVLRAAPAPRRHGAGGRRDRHDEQLRRAPRGGRRPDRAGGARPSATRRRVIAGTDCGFDTTAGIGDVAPSLVWEKLARPAGRRRPGVGAPVLRSAQPAADRLAVVGALLLGSVERGQAPPANRARSAPSAEASPPRPPRGRGRRRRRSPGSRGPPRAAVARPRRSGGWWPCGRGGRPLDRARPCGQTSAVVASWLVSSVIGGTLRTAPYESPPVGNQGMTVWIGREFSPAPVGIDRPRSGRRGCSSARPGRRRRGRCRR